jgi:hypothetical protein
MDKNRENHFTMPTEGEGVGLDIEDAAADTPTVPRAEKQAEPQRNLG